MFPPSVNCLESGASNVVMSNMGPVLTVTAILSLWGEGHVCREGAFSTDDFMLGRSSWRPGCMWKPDLVWESFELIPQDEKGQWSKYLTGSHATACQNTVWKGFGFKITFPSHPNVSPAEAELAVVFPLSAGKTSEHLLSSLLLAFPTSSPTHSSVSCNSPETPESLGTLTLNPFLFILHTTPCIHNETFSVSASSYGFYQIFFLPLLSLHT